MNDLLVVIQCGLMVIAMLGGAELYHELRLCDTGNVARQQRR